MKPETSLMADDWSLGEVASFARVKGGKRLPAGEEFADGVTPYPYLRVTNMVNGTVDDEGIVYVKPEIQKVISNYTISSNDIYVTIAGTLGLFGRIPQKYGGAQLTENAAKLTNINLGNFDLDYLNYSLNGDFIQSQVNREIGIGAGVPKLALYRIEKLKVPFPAALKEQQKIAKILTTVDNLIEKTEALIEKYQAIKHGMMHDLFTRGIDTNGQLRPSHHEAPHLYRQTELGWIPKGWAVVMLADIASVDRGKFTHRPRDDARCYGGELPFIQTGDVAKSLGGFLNTYCQTLSEFGANVSRSFPPGTVAVTIAANIADTAILGTEMYFPDSVVGVVPKSEIQPRYIELCIRRNKRRLDAIAPLSAQKNINLEDLRPLKIPLPIEKEREAICRRYETIFNSIKHEKAFLSKLFLQKKGLMQDLLTGKVSVAC